MAKEPENDLAQLFAAALEDEETRHSRGSSPAKGKTARPAPAGESTADTLGAPARAPKAATLSKVPAAKPAAPTAAPSKPAVSSAGVSARGSSPAAPASRSSGATLPPSGAPLSTLPPAPSGAGRASGASSVSSASGATQPGAASRSPGATLPPTPARSSGVTLPPTPSRSPAATLPPSSRPAPVAPSAMPGMLSAATAPATAPPMPALSPAAARAPTSALPSQRPGARPAEPEGLTAIPRSEAMTMDRVPAHRSDAPPSRPGPRLSMPPVDPPRAPDARTAEPRPSLAPAQRNKTTAAEIRGRPAAELSIESAAEQLDHKGRSKPIFAPRTPRPQAKRLSPAVELAAGLFPGARLMAKERVASGLGYAIVGALALIPAVVVLVGWSARTAAVARLNLDPHWITAHAAALVASVALFELVRCLSVLEPSRRHAQPARVAAALLLPAAVVTVGAPLVVGSAPGWVEPTWFLALPVGALAAVAAVDVLTRPDPSSGHRAALVAGAAVMASVLVVALVLILSVDTRAGLARRAEAAGFTKLPQVLRSMNVGS